MSGVLKNQRHELFAQNLAMGETADRAYELAGYEADRSNAAKLTTNHHILARVKELQEGGAIKAELTIADIVKKLEMLEASAIANNQISAGVTAVMGMAKILGLIVDRQETTGRNGGAIEVKETTDQRRIAALALLLARKD